MPEYTVTFPFEPGEDAYISEKYYCNADQALKCKVHSYSFGSAFSFDSRWIFAKCFLPGYGMTTFHPENLFRTEADAIKARKAKHE